MNLLNAALFMFHIYTILFLLTFILIPLKLYHLCIDTTFLINLRKCNFTFS